MGSKCWAMCCAAVFTFVMMAFAASAQLPANQLKNWVKVDRDGNLTFSIDPTEQIEYDAGESVTWTVGIENHHPNLLLDSVVVDEPSSPEGVMIQWLKDGDPVDDQSYQVIIDRNQTSLTIRNASQADGGMYQLKLSLLLDDKDLDRVLLLNFTLRVKGL